MKKNAHAFLLALFAVSIAVSPTFAASSKAKLITDTATSANTVPYINAGAAEDSTAATAMSIQVGGTEMMRVTATGSVGIGTTTPAQRLDLGGGNIKMGYEQVSNSCGALASAWIACSVSCSSGKTVIGGGCNIDGAADRISMPSGTSGWTCYSSAAATQSVAYAICANIQ